MFDRSIIGFLCICVKITSWQFAGFAMMTNAKATDSFAAAAVSTVTRF